ncbi:MAG: VanZ family protein [Flavobacteriaceae bacterium]
MPKKILLVIALLYTIALAVLSLLSSGNLPDLEVDYADKVAHLIAYGVLYFVWQITLDAYKIPKAILIASGFAITYGIILEVLQGTLTVGRTLDMYDVLANCIGVVIILIVYKYKNKTHVKNL